MQLNRRKSEPLPIAYQHEKIIQNAFPIPASGHEVNQAPTTTPIYHSPTQQRLLNEASTDIQTIQQAHQPAVVSPKENNNITPTETLNVLNTLVQASNKKSSPVLTSVIAFLAVTMSLTSALLSLTSPVACGTLGIVTACLISLLIYRVVSVTIFNSKNMDLFENLYNQNKTPLLEFSISKHVLCACSAKIYHSLRKKSKFPSRFFSLLL